MAKKLVSEKDVEALVRDGNFYMDGTLILTPGAKDVLREKGVAIVYGPKPETCEENICDRDKLEAAVATILNKKYGITDQAQIKAFSSLVVNITEQND